MQVLHWSTVIVSIKFLFDFLVTENLDTTLFKAVQINSPKC